MDFNLLDWEQRVVASTVFTDFIDLGSCDSRGKFEIIWQLLNMNSGSTRTEDYRQFDSASCWPVEVIRVPANLVCMKG
jgi:hypothetical protein